MPVSLSFAPLRSRHHWSCTFIFTLSLWFTSFRILGIRLFPNQVFPLHWLASVPPWLLFFCSCLCWPHCKWLVFISPTCWEHLEFWSYPPRFCYLIWLYDILIWGEHVPIPSSQSLLEMLSSPGHRLTLATYHLCLPSKWHAIINYSLGELYGLTGDMHL